MTTIEGLKWAAHAVQGFSAEKPHSSVTDWIEILSSEKYSIDDLDGIPELVESVNIQGMEGTTEAARAIRKKLKYGNIHRQLRALTILKALVENCGPRFRTGFANAQFCDRIKLMAADPMTDESVKKRLLALLASWHRLFKDDPKMKTVADLYIACGGGKGKTVAHHERSSTRDSATLSNVSASPPNSARDFDGYDGQTLWERQQRIEQEEARLRQERERKRREDDKRKLQEEKKAIAREREELAKEKIRVKMEREKAAADAKKAKEPPKAKRPPFNYEKEKPNILNSIATASQCSNNLINALKLVNREKETVQANPRVQDTLQKAKLARRQIVRYIQLTENEEVIGTLLETNERIISSIFLYDQMCKPAEHDSDEERGAAEAAKDPAEAARARVEARGARETELDKLQIKQRERVERVNSMRDMHGERPARRSRASHTQDEYVHPDLRDLSFGPIAGRNSLPEPLRPSEDSDDDRQAGLSDYSDYDSEDERYGSGSHHTHSRQASTSSQARYDTNTSNGNGKNLGSGSAPAGGSGLLVDLSDPFADPDEGVSTPGIADKKPIWAE
ncbi:hypothetical protein DACRYDRAFT_23555 [Dacryopinax primogenitus]|uniref:VHS domain-containing protein n=1 Tax=Dacryopinax primogenitus (strain DJM 731) TaxID=1858805 RepID=M5G2C4_DACPD|nr:uncharacterized protein DACRYDRAFT_23555 [Dacryopinax primogenitus]EJU00017.1 hypothetical protein DACRYDRAFT_23555 [Dacryopinax primogenitus]